LRIREFGTVYPPQCGSLTLNLDALTTFKGISVWRDCGALVTFDFNAPCTSRFTYLLIYHNVGFGVRRVGVGEFVRTQRTPPLDPPLRTADRLCVGLCKSLCTLYTIQHKTKQIMAALRSRCGHYIFAVSVFLFFLAKSQRSQTGCLPYFDT